MKRKISTLMTGLCVAVVISLSGCGGGGTTTNDAGATYRGNTAQATISASNAKSVSVDAVQGIQSIASTGVLGKSVATVPTPAPLLQSVSTIFEESISHVSPKTVVAKSVAETVQGTKYGYSGSYTYSGTGNQTTGAISGTITFNAYTPYSYSSAVSGTISFSGTADSGTGALINATMTFANISVLSGSQTITLNGTVSIAISGTTHTLNVSVVMADNIANRTYWAKDFSLVLTGTSMTLSGTYYDHVHGYVTISTISPLAVSSYSSTSTSGALLFSGNNGTKARLTYTDTGSGYTLEVDTAGTNVYVVVL